MNGFDDPGGKKVIWGLLFLWVGLLYLAHSMEPGPGKWVPSPHGMHPSSPPGMERSPGEEQGPPGGIEPPHFEPTVLNKGGLSL